MVCRIEWNAEAPSPSIDTHSSPLKFHIHCGPKNILSSSFPFIHFSYFYTTYWSRKKQQLSFLTIGRWLYTSLPTSTSSACTRPGGLTSSVPTKNTSEEAPQHKQLSPPLPQPPTHRLGTPSCTPSRRVVSSRKRRSCTRNWHGSIPRSSLSYWFHSVT